MNFTPRRSTRSVKTTEKSPHVLVSTDTAVEVVLFRRWKSWISSKPSLILPQQLSGMVPHYHWVKTKSSHFPRSPRWGCYHPVFSDTSLAGRGDLGQYFIAWWEWKSSLSLYWGGGVGVSHSFFLGYLAGIQAPCLVRLPPPFFFFFLVLWLETTGFCFFGLLACCLFLYFFFCFLCLFLSAPIGVPRLLLLHLQVWKYEAVKKPRELTTMFLGFQVS